MDDYITDTFTHLCPDCDRTIRVVDGQTKRHWCRCPRWLRGKRTAAWLEGYEFARQEARDGEVAGGSS